MLTWKRVLVTSLITCNFILIFDFTSLKVTAFMNNEAKGTKVIGATSLPDMVNKLKSPRRVMLLVKGENK